MTHRPSQRLSRRMTHGACVSELNSEIASPDKIDSWSSCQRHFDRKAFLHTKGFKVAKGRKAISPRIRLEGGVEALESNYRHERHFDRRNAFLKRKECGTF